MSARKPAATKSTAKKSAANKAAPSHPTWADMIKVSLPFFIYSYLRSSCTLLRDILSTIRSLQTAGQRVECPCAQFSSSFFLKCSSLSALSGISCLPSDDHFYDRSAVLTMLEPRVGMYRRPHGRCSHWCLTPTDQEVSCVDT
jgi:hypothetical protein